MDSAKVSLKMHRVLHVAEWLSRERGGVAPVVYNLARGEVQIGVEASVAGLADDYFAVDAKTWTSDVPVFAADVRGPQSFGYVPAYARRMARFCSSPDIVHSHGLWMYPNLMACRWAGARKIPVVISPHGLLEPWALSWLSWKKRIARCLYADRELRAAACLHALCAPEVESLRKYGVRNPIAVIPNGVNLDDYSSLPSGELLSSRFTEVSGKRIILFLGRIHPKKGLIHLAEAWGRLARSFPDWHLVIAGPDEGNHQAAVQAKLVSLGVADHTTFAGILRGEDKLAAFAAADIFVLPSFSEGFSVAILEALCCHLPVLLSSRCNFPEAAAYGAAVEVEPNARSTEVGLRQVMEMDPRDRAEMGEKGHRLVSEHYTWASIARDMAAVYEWCLGGGSCPSTVRID